MEDQNQQNPKPLQPQSYTGMSHEKVIQPSTELAQELKATQAEQMPIQPQTAQPASPESVIADGPTPSVEPQPAYPERTTGYSTPPMPMTSDTPLATQAPSESGNSSKVTAIRVVSSVLIVLSLINLYNWYLQQHAGYTNVVTLAEIGVTLGLLIGIAMLKEIARVIYVFIAGVLLLISVISIVQLYAQKTTTTQSDLSTPTTAELRTSLERSLAISKTNKNPTPAQKAAQQSVQQELDSLSSSSVVTSKTKRYITEVLLVVVAVGPLVFLTRPSIKEAFN